MTKKELRHILDSHSRWVTNGEGERANLRGADLCGTNLSRANLRNADLRGADLSGAGLSGADLCGAGLSSADLIDADLRDANLIGANLIGANLRRAYLIDANLRGADLSGADLSVANLSHAKGLATSAEWVEAQDTDESGVLVYKAIGSSTPYAPPAHWMVEPGAVLTETVNPDRCTTCGCGINVAPLEWVRKKYPQSQIWRCRIAWVDLADLVVPFGTDGKARCGRITLLEVVDEMS